MIIHKNSDVKKNSDVFMIQMNLDLRRSVSLLRYSAYSRFSRGVVEVHWERKLRRHSYNSIWVAQWEEEEEENASVQS